MTQAEGRIVVAGGTAVGLLFRVESPPHPGETIIAHSMVYIDGGKGAGQAIGVRRLGSPTSLISAVGDDALGNRLLNLLTREDIDASAVSVIEGEGSMLGMVLVDDKGENQIVVALNAMSHLSAERVRQHESIIAQSECCLVSLEIPFGAALETLTLARKHGVTTILNPAPAPSPAETALLAPVSDFITPNETEGRSMIDDPEADDESVARRLMELGAGAVAMTLGSDGALLVDGSCTERIPTPQVDPANIADTAGAGDAFNAAFAVAIARGKSPIDASRLGCEAGSRIVQGPGFVEALHTWEGFSID